MEEKKHVLHLEERSSLSISGILSVISFCEESAELESTLGDLEITGERLHMEKLDLERGEVILTGRIRSLYYPDDGEEEKGLFKRIFSK